MTLTVFPRYRPVIWLRDIIPGPDGRRLSRQSAYDIAARLPLNCLTRYWLGLRPAGQLRYEPACHVETPEDRVE